MKLTTTLCRTLRKCLGLNWRQKVRNLDFREANFRVADFRGADFSGADFREADFSGAKIMSQLDWLDKYLEKTAEGYIVYKSFSENYKPNPVWKIEPDSIISEIVNYAKTDDCGCGVNVATLELAKNNCVKRIWKCLLRFEWLGGVCIPLGTTGKFRCEKIQLLELLP